MAFGSGMPRDRFAQKMHWQGAAAEKGSGRAGHKSARHAPVQSKLRRVATVDDNRERIPVVQLDRACQARTPSPRRGFSTG